LLRGWTWRSAEGGGIRGLRRGEFLREPVSASTTWTSRTVEVAGAAGRLRFAGGSRWSPRRVQALLREVLAPSDDPDLEVQAERNHTACSTWRSTTKTSEVSGVCGGSQLARRLRRREEGPSAPSDGSAQTCSRLSVGTSLSNSMR